MKHLDVNLTNCEQYMYAENYKMLMKEIKKTKMNRVVHGFHGLEDSMS